MSLLPWLILIIIHLLLSLYSVQYLHKLHWVCSSSSQKSTRGVSEVKAGPELSGWQSCRLLRSEPAGVVSDFVPRPFCASAELRAQVTTDQSTGSKRASALAGDGDWNPPRCSTFWGAEKEIKRVLKWASSTTTLWRENNPFGCFLVVFIFVRRAQVISGDRH